MSKYDEIDAAIIDSISLGVDQVYRLECMHRTILGRRFSNSSDCTLRVLDRRLQALRKRGVIWYDREHRAWRPA